MFSKIIITNGPFGGICNNYLHTVRNGPIATKLLKESLLAESDNINNIIYVHEF